MISFFKSLARYYLRSGWLPIVIFFAITEQVIPLMIHFDVNLYYYKWVIFSFILPLYLGLAASSIYCYRHGKWIWGSIHAVLFILYVQEPISFANMGNI